MWGIKLTPSTKINLPSYLTNVFKLEFDTGNGIVKSLRFGTPYAPKDSIGFYEAQVLTLRNYIGEKKCFFVSLMDICDNRLLCFFGGEKANENSIAHAEIEGYYKDENIAYFNMPCNSSVNLSKKLSVVSNENLRIKLGDIHSLKSSLIFLYN